MRSRMANAEKASGQPPVTSIQGLNGANKDRRAWFITCGL